MYSNKPQERSDDTIKLEEIIKNAKLIAKKIEKSKDPIHTTNKSLRLIQKMISFIDEIAELKA